MARRGSTPSAAAPTDQQLAENITAHVRWDARVNVQDLEVTVRDGAVTLSGVVPSVLARQAAEEAARAVAGVREVENALRVAHGRTQSPASDEQILANARQVLEWSPAIDLGAIDIGISGGSVILTGWVDELWKKAHATELVSRIPGVTGVDNRLDVRPASRFDDEAIEDDIRSALRRSITMDADEVDVRVRDGLVILTGRVPNHRAREDASQAAFFTRGVVAVRNQIDVDPSMARGKLRTADPHPTGDGPPRR